MTLHDDHRQASEAWADLMYAIFSATGIIWLSKRFCGGLNDKYREAEIRAEWRRK